MTARSSRKARNLRPARDPDHATERWLQSLHTDPADGYTVPFEGASDVGVMPGPDTQPFTVDNVRDIGYRTWDLRPPQPPPPGPTPLCAETAEGWAHIFTITCHHCGLAGWNDDAPTYDALYRSAWDAGWRQDKLRYWACRRCAQFSGQYEALWPVAVWAEGAADARARNEMAVLGPENGMTSRVPREFALTVQGAEGLRERTLLHYDASHRRGTHARQATA